MWKSLLAVCAVLSSPALAQGGPGFGGPPPEAREACLGKAQGAACRIQTPRGQLEGTCRQVPEAFACVPSRGGPSQGGPEARSGNSPGMPENRSPSQAGQAGRGGATAPHGADIAGDNPTAIPTPSRIPDTRQGSCFDERQVIPCPAPGQPFFGQDAHYLGAAPSYHAPGDGTVLDRVTGLMWQQAHNPQRLDWYAAREACARLNLAGYRDWRLPSIKELFSIADFRGSVGRRPYLDEVFKIEAPDASVLVGDRFAASHSTAMMGQTWSATLYTGDHWGRKGVEAAFFMNFLDGHIKQAPTQGRNTQFYRCVRGKVWGDNDFRANGDDTVSDQASGLMWQQHDDGQTRDWPAALAYCQTLRLAGHRDWRLPNIKELQSLVDYRRHDPALDERFLKQRDKRAWFWSSTTHGDSILQADYICFGKCTSADGVDVHGAGAQRSDPKRQGLVSRTTQGGQNDEIRINNAVRCVR